MRAGAPAGPGVMTAAMSCPAATRAASTGGEKMQCIPKKRILTGGALVTIGRLTPQPPSSTVPDGCTLDLAGGSLKWGAASHLRDADGSKEMARMVNCVKLGRELPGLDRPPFPGPLGQRIYDNVSAEGYALWVPHMTLLINHYGLNPADPETRQIMRDQMEEFFFGAEARVPEGWVPPGAGGSSKGGAAPRKK